MRDFNYQSRIHDLNAKILRAEKRNLMDLSMSDRISNENYIETMIDRRDSLQHEFYIFCKNNIHYAIKPWIIGFILALDMFMTGAFLRKVVYFYKWKMYFLNLNLNQSISVALFFISLATLVNYLINAIIDSNKKGPSND